MAFQPFQVSPRTVEKSLAALSFTKGNNRIRHLAGALEFHVGVAEGTFEKTKR